MSLDLIQLRHDPTFEEMREHIKRVEYVFVVPPGNDIEIIVAKHKYNIYISKYVYDKETKSFTLARGSCSARDLDSALRIARDMWLEERAKALAAPTVSST